MGGDNQPAQSFTRGKSALSNKRVLAPDLTRKEAQVLPAGPPPTIMASNVGVGFMMFFYNFLIITTAFLSVRYFRSLKSTEFFLGLRIYLMTAN
jgi:hypothetical protein